MTASGRGRTSRRGLKAQEMLLNYAIPEMNGIGAQEICVTTAQGLRFLYLPRWTRTGFLNGTAGTT